MLYSGPRTHPIRWDVRLFVWSVHVASIVLTERRPRAYGLHDNGPEKGKAPRPGEGRGAVKESGPPAYGNKEKKKHAPAGPGTP